MDLYQRKNDVYCLAAINDAAPYGANDVARFARNDALFALMCPQARIMFEGHIISVATSFARQGKHH